VRERGGARRGVRAPAAEGERERGGGRGRGEGTIF